MTTELPPTLIYYDSSKLDTGNLTNPFLMFKDEEIIKKWHQVHGYKFISENITYLNYDAEKIRMIPNDKSIPNNKPRIRFNVLHSVNLEIQENKYQLVYYPELCNEEGEFIYPQQIIHRMKMHALTHNNNINLDEIKIICYDVNREEIIDYTQINIHEPKILEFSYASREMPWFKFMLVLNISLTTKI